jgi:hypothetical protein
VGIGRGRRALRGHRAAEKSSTLERDGLSAEGEIGDGDPVQAMEDKLRKFPADRIISTHPVGRSIGFRARRDRARASASKFRHARRRRPRARGRRLGYLMERVPFFPACSWPGTLQ